MTKPIPRRIKNNYFLGMVKTQDIIILFIGFFIALLVAISNIISPSAAINIVTGFVVMAIFIVAVLRFDEESIYDLTFNAIKYLVLPKKYKGKQVQELIGVKNITDGFVNFENGFFSKMIEIESMEFFTLDPTTRTKLITGIANLVKGVDKNISLQLFKCDRPVRLEPFCLDIARDMCNMRKSKLFSKDEKEIRLEILNEQYNRLGKIKKNFDMKIPRFYLIIKSESRKQINTFINRGKRFLDKAHITYKDVNNKETAIVYKYMICNKCNESEVDKISDESLKNWILPNEIKFNKKDTIIDKERYYTIGVVEYPQNATDAFANRLFAKEGTVTLNLNYIEHARAKKLINTYYAEIVNKRGGKLSDVMDNSDEKYAIKDTMRQIKNETETMLLTNLYYTFQAKDYGSFKEECKEIKGLDFNNTKNIYKQEEVYLSKLTNKNYKKVEFNLTSEIVGLMFPFTHSIILERDGIFIGATDNGAPTIINFDKRYGCYNASNMVIFGTIGSGKSFSTKTLLTLLAAKGQRIFVFDPTPEYTILANNLHGQMVDLGTGIFKINPFQVFITMTESDDDNAQAVSPLVAHLSILRVFYSIIFDGLTPNEFELLNNLTNKLYERFGMTDPNYDFVNAKKEDYPIFTDLSNLIDEEIENAKDVFTQNMLQVVKLHLNKCTTGVFAKYWNGYSVIDLHSNFIVFDFSTLLKSGDKQVANAQMRLIATFVNSEMTRNYNIMKAKGNYQVIQDDIAPITLIVDEAHTFLNPKSPTILELMKDFAKQCRKYSGKLITVTQAITDLIPTEEVTYLTKPLLDEAQYTFFYKASKTGFEDINERYRSLELTEQEKVNMLNADKGHALLVQDAAKRNGVQIVTSPKVQQLFEKKSQ